MTAQIVPQTLDPELVAHCEQTWEETMRSIEALAPKQFPGAMIECDVERLMSLRSDVGAIEYTVLRTSRLMRHEYTPTARAEINRQCAERVGAVLS